MNIKPKLPHDWLELLSDEFFKPYFLELKQFLLAEKAHYPIYPRGQDIFNAFNTTRLNKLKVVILGQDPYHGAGQAHGLAFSVQEGVRFPPSLQNIFTELESDLGCPRPISGNLTPWAQQGVFLLNTVLTVRADTAHSHKDHGWERFTDAVIEKIASTQEGVVFILWGKPAQSKRVLIDAKRHLILEAPHPSPLSSYRGFFGSKPFSRSNDYLRSLGKEPIDWCLPI